MRHAPGACGCPSATAKDTEEGSGVPGAGNGYVAGGRRTSEPAHRSASAGDEGETAPNGSGYREEVLEKLASYRAGELSREEARRVERLIAEDPEALRLTGLYLRTLALLVAEEGENGHGA